MNSPPILDCGCQHGFHYCSRARALHLAVTRTRALALSGASDSFGSDAWERYYSALKAYEKHFDVSPDEKELAG